MPAYKKLNAVKTAVCLILISVILAGTLSGCSGKDPLDPKNPVTLTLWHPYGYHMKTVFEALITEFNETVGEHRGIIVQTAYIADAADLNEQLIAAVNGDPGAPALPDIAIINPRIAITLVDRDLLMDFSTQFSADELRISPKAR